MRDRSVLQEAFDSVYRHAQNHPYALDALMVPVAGLAGAGGGYLAESFGPSTLFGIGVDGIQGDDVWANRDQRIDLTTQAAMLGGLAGAGLGGLRRRAAGRGSEFGAVQGGMYGAGGLGLGMHMLNQAGSLGLDAPVNPETGMPVYQ